MSLWSWLSGGKAVAEPIQAVGNVLDALFTSDDERLDKAIIKQRLSQQPALAQAEITKVQAQHRSIFVAGARPSILWVCSLGFLMSFVINPVMQWAGLEGIELPTDIMLELTLAMLGLSSLRTVEKLNGVSK
tara:strand:+ start:63 stop:458 length:396 start_codon:yes stop_codon:yes gene_type:complete